MLGLLRGRGLLIQERIELLLSWRRSGFCVHNRVFAHPGDGRDFEALVRYMMRSPVSPASNVMRGVSMASLPRIERARVFVAASGFCLLVASIAWGGPLPSTTPEEVGLSSERLQRISARLRKDVDEGVYPGAVVLVARRGKVAYFESFGWRDKDSGAPMPKDAIFRIFSMTKPIVSVAAMMLHEEGRFFLWEPVSKYLPALANLRRGVEGPRFSTARLQREMNIQDLLRHTSGLTYEGDESVVRRMYKEAGIGSWDDTAAEMVEKLGKMPLAYEPGTRFEYGRSTDVVGRLIEVISGMPLDRFLEERIFKPLGMVDSGFWVRPEKKSRVAQPGKRPEFFDFDPTVKPRFLSGGGGGVSTVGDYARFAQMLLNGGQLDGNRLLGPKTVQYMTSDHLGSVASLSDGLYAPGDWWYGPGPGCGFGLGFAIRLEGGHAEYPGTQGAYFWSGYAGTHFWVDPEEELIAVVMAQKPDDVYVRSIIRSLVYPAIIE